MRLLQNNDGSLVCTCGNDIFATMGDDFGFTAIECIKCNQRTSILESTLIAEKLLNAYGEDYCVPDAANFTKNASPPPP